MKRFFSIFITFSFIFAPFSIIKSNAINCPKNYSTVKNSAGIVLKCQVLPGKVVIKRKGYKLTAVTKGWASGLTYSYQWYVNGKKPFVMNGGHRKKLTLHKKDDGKKYFVKVKAYSNKYKTSVTKKSSTKFLILKKSCRKGKIICIDKNYKVLKLFYIKNGRVLQTMRARFGCVGNETRAGHFRIFAKVKDEFSKEYDTEMPYAMYFAGGQAIHYSSNFAQTGYRKCSYGCVNLRDKKGTKKLFKRVKLGTKVYIYN